jgi:GntR family transcriptional repressor for pyruvate dehydrogenase complex
MTADSRRVADGQPLSNPLKSIEREKLYLEIVEQILDAIKSGAFPAGAALPSERVMAGQLGVSRASLREAIRVLEHAGVLDVRMGSGTYVVEDGPSPKSVLRTRAALIGEHSPLDISLARWALEPVVAAQAALNRHDSDLAILDRHFEAHQVLVQDGKDGEEPDLAFHLALANATYNLVLVDLVERLVEIMHQQTWREFRVRQLRHAGRGLVFVDQHRRLLDAVIARDSVEAEAAMRTHLEAVTAGVTAEAE